MPVPVRVRALETRLNLDYIEHSENDCSTGAKMKLSEVIRPISYLKSHAAEIVKDFENNRNPLIITQNGVAKMVVMDIRTYEEQLETMAFLKLVHLGKKEIADGKFQSAHDFFAEMDKEQA
jgi:prevent-host-death family protein